MQIAALLRLQFSEYDHYKSTPLQQQKHREVHGLFAPDTGSRLLLTVSEKVPRQICHLDFLISENASICNNTRGMKYAPYFIMASGQDEMPIWMSEGSHRFVATTEHDMKELGKRYTLDLFRIPPWSVFVVRGDVFHAGAGGKECKGKRCLRIHMFLMRKGVAIGDTINHFVGQFMQISKKDGSNLQGRLRKF